MIFTNLNRLTPEFIKGIVPYLPSKPDDVLQRLYGCERIFRMNNNENPLGPPRAAATIIEKYPPHLAAVYPSGDVYHLRYRLSEYLGVEPERILVGNGANEAITFVIKAFCEAGDNIITADKTFAVYEWVAEFSGFEARLVPLNDFTFDDEGMLARVDERTKILFVCNPNNPTGTYWDEARLRNFLNRVDGRQVVVVDEAYNEFVEKPDFPNGIQLIDEYPNLVVFRTFSKMFGLAGLRIGYLVGAREVVDIVRRTCVVYSVNSVGQAAALAALDDPDHISRTRDHVASAKDFLGPKLRELGLEPQIGEGNFLMVKLPISDTIVYRLLMKSGVMIRTMTGFRFPKWIRISIASPEAHEAFIRALGDILRDR